MAEMTQSHSSYSRLEIELLILLEAASLQGLGSGLVTWSWGRKEEDKGGFGGPCLCS